MQPLRLPSSVSCGARGVLEGRSASESWALAGVFEHDGETGYIYLYDQFKSGNQRVTGAIHVLSGRLDFSESEVEVRWSKDEELVGFFVRGRLWAAFRGAEKYGGDYRSEGQADILDSVVPLFGAC